MHVNMGRIFEYLEYFPTHQKRMQYLPTQRFCNGCGDKMSDAKRTSTVMTMSSATCDFVAYCDDSCLLLSPEKVTTCEKCTSLQ